MSLILDALKRLEAKAPPKAPAVVPPLEAPAAPALTQTEPPRALANEIELQPAVPDDIVLESVQISVADTPAEEWFEQTEMYLSGPDLSDEDVDVQIAIGALQGDVRDLDLAIKALNEAETIDPVAESVDNPSVEAIETAAEELPLANAPTETIDFAAELANLWDEATEEVIEPVAPVAEAADDTPNETISFGPLDEELVSADMHAPVEAIQETVEDFTPEAVTSEEVAAPDDVTDEAADAEVPDGSILAITDFRRDIAEPAPEELPDDHDVLAAQLAELEYRGLRDNVISQLFDAPVALLFAAPDDNTDVVDVVVQLGNSLAQLKCGDVVIVCSQKLRDSYRASPEYSELQLTRSSGSGRPTATLVIDPADAGDRLVADLKRRCRWVLFAADAATSRRWSPLCDATYVVVGLGNTDRNAAVKSVTSLEMSGGHVLGCVLTEVPDVA